jgi:ribosome-associated heat shock protein Hsp15
VSPRDRQRADTDARDEDDDDHRVRLDKWLWAARFFKTRGLAADAIDGGKIEVNGDRAKRARLVQPGDSVRVRHGPFEHVVVVRELSARRGPATEAAKLYEETAESKAARERIALQHKLAAVRFEFEEGKPSKKDRREIDKWRGRA